MEKVVSEFFLIWGVLLAIVVGLIALLWYLVHDQKFNHNKFAWHRLFKNSFHLSYVDELNKTWTVDITYNSPITEPIHKAGKEGKFQIIIPATCTRECFVNFIESIDDLDGGIQLIIKGIVDDTILSDLDLSKEDNSIYREFRRDLLLKALKG